MQLRRDVLLMVLTIIVGAFAALIVTIANRSEWSIVTIAWNAIVLILLVFMIWVILKGLQIMYEKENEQREIENKKLVDDTVDKTLTDLGLKK